MTGLEVELVQGRHRVARAFVRKRRLPASTGVILRVHGRAPKAGRYTLVVQAGLSDARAPRDLRSLNRSP